MKTCDAALKLCNWTHFVVVLHALDLNTILLLKVSCMNEIPSCIRCCNDTHSFIHIKYDAIQCKKIVLIAADESLDL